MFAPEFGRTNAINGLHASAAALMPPMRLDTQKFSYGKGVGTLAMPPAMQRLEATSPF
jgi:hypothetical protein